MPITYTNTATTNNFIVDNGNDGRYLEWETSDDLNIASYTVTISATNMCVTASASYTLEVRSVCEGQLLEIDPSNAKFSSPALIQNIWQPVDSLLWDENDVVAEYPLYDCGPLVFELVTQFDTAPDAAVFTLDAAFDPRQLIVFTEDSAEAGTYPLRIKVTFFDWPYNPGAVKDFTVQVSDICEEVPYSITPSAATADVTNLVARPAHVTPAMDQFTVVPDYCPITYTFEVIPDPGDPAIFTFDDTNLIHTIVTSDIAKAGVYTV